ncbi:hypothetical protein PFICI_12643 [Pestalotiopsis fici W106-1]|uniref:Fido domain-containing protein n=1 Tax=Pestalotiopsis fici (strain W106-1 / CGMCC3.15140) TaxID=1229662 RepID=W3WPG4_PESFW|nr:uncharacterized protein PFICI_12643 [Pestalotiopsis fici W106-1]ETS75699.1 hypothetical protein PFICI_12643 [Pestalotiopsis fici W106-1]
MEDIYRVHSHSDGPAKPLTEVFAKVLSSLTSIQAQSLPQDEMKRIDGIEKQLRQSMNRVVFGSNYIEHVGLGLNETLGLCERVFQGEDVEIIDERTPDYEKRLWEEYGAQLNSKDDRTVKSFSYGRTEVINHAKAFQYMIDQIVSLDMPITEECITTTHRILCQDTPIFHRSGSVTDPLHYAGIYRDVRNIHVGAGDTMFTPPKKVPGAMKAMIADLNQDLENAQKHKKIDPFALAAKYSMQFVQIHPFQDGNGRMCRLILNTILCKYAGVVVPIGEDEDDKKAYIDIKKRASADALDHGEYATFVLQKSEIRLRNLKKMLSGKKRSTTFLL